MQGDLTTMLQNLISGIGKGRGNKGIVLIWHVAMWSIWLARNELIFSNKKQNVDELVEGIKRRSPEWLLKRKDGIPSLLYE
ncbi:hypothetical protein TSUD_306460 [Trifolium subterraneum]|uniref:Uncharacterized protein n=1 Tax=Trifolium subterraneum TaxID=3900 RepID=A0A2Z6PEE6_TRISU|nr:hypothetical protein TSUD_306460 [Trifolium subterraneum]